MSASARRTLCCAGEEGIEGWWFLLIPAGTRGALGQTFAGRNCNFAAALFFVRASIGDEADNQSVVLFCNVRVCRAGSLSDPESVLGTAPFSPSARSLLRYQASHASACCGWLCETRVHPCYGKRAAARVLVTTQALTYRISPGGGGFPPAKYTTSQLKRALLIGLCALPYPTEHHNRVPFCGRLVASE